MITKRNDKTIRNGWIIRAEDRFGEIFYRCISESTGEWYVDRQNDELNDLIPHLQVFAKKEIAESWIAATRDRILECVNANTGYPCNLPLRKIEAVQCRLSIG